MLDIRITTDLSDQDRERLRRIEVFVSKLDRIEDKLDQLLAVLGDESAMPTLVADIVARTKKLKEAIALVVPSVPEPGPGISKP